MANIDLDEGFDEVPLDEGFEEVSLDQPIVSESPKAKLKQASEEMFGRYESPTTVEDTTEEVISNPKAAMLGAQEGLLLGGAGETAGAVQSSLDFLQRYGNKVAPSLIDKSPTQVSEELQQQGFTGDVGPTSTEDLYTQGREEQEAQIEQARKEAPKAFMTGMIGGGLAGAAATGAYGTAKLAPQIGKALGASELGFIAAAKQGAVPLGKAIATEAISSIPAGMAYGALSADPGKRLSGAATGAAEGSLTSVVARGAIEGVPYALSKTGEVLGEKVGTALQKIYTPKKGASDVRQQESFAYEAGLEGKKITDPKFVEGKSQAAEQMGLTGSNALNRASLQESKKITENLLARDSELSKAVGSVLDQAEQEGKRFNLFDPETRDSFLKFYNNLTDLDANIFNRGKIKDVGTKLLNDVPLTPTEIKDFKNELFRLMSQYSKDPSANARFISENLGEFAKSLTGNLRKQVPGYAQASDRLQSFRKLVFEPMLSGTGATTLQVGEKAIPVGFVRFADDLSGSREELYNTINKLINDVGRPGTTRESKQLLNGLMDSFKEAKATQAAINPEGAAKIAKTLDDSLANIEKTAVQTETFRKLESKNPLAQPSTNIKPTSLFDAVLGGEILDTTRIKAANLTGRIQKGIQEGKISPRIQESLDKLKQLDPNDTIKSNALFNTLLQNGTIREYLNNLDKKPQETEDEQ